jgi:sterol 3beta-glucosyltransferase
MQLSIVAVGSGGDVHPCIALGLGLKSAGYPVQICADRIFKSLVAATGLSITPMTAAPVNIMQQDLSRVGSHLRLIGQIFQGEHGVEKAVSMIQPRLEKNQT